MRRIPLLAIALLLSAAAHGDNAVVGSGTPGSCTEAALDIALNQLVVGTQGPGGTLAFDCGAAPHTIAITTPKFLSGQIVVDGGNRITLDAQNLVRHFGISVEGPDGRTEVVVRNLALARGFAAGDHGGAILLRSGAKLDLARVTIRDSRAGLSGGAIAVEFGAPPMSITDSSFIQNRAQNGGAIATSAGLAVTGSRFLGNSADVDEGGAIQSYFGDLDIDRSVFGANSAARGGAIYKRDGELVVQGSRLQDNLARGDGGAIYSAANVSRFLVSASYLDRNLADQGAGGAILAGGKLDVFGTGFDANRAPRGAALRLLDAQFVSVGYSTFSYNEADLGGGAIAVSAAPPPPDSDPPVLYVNDSTFAFNRVTAVGGVGGDVWSTAGSNMVTAIVKSTLFGSRAESGGWSLHVGAGNTALLASDILYTASSDTCRAEPGATITTGGNNLGPSLACQLGHGSDTNLFMSADFELEAFGDNGGPQRTFLPRAISPAVDRRACDTLDQVDMRLRPRGVDGNGVGTASCDIGAVERQRGELATSLFRNGFEDHAQAGSN